MVGVEHENRSRKHFLSPTHIVTSIFRRKSVFRGHLWAHTGSISTSELLYMTISGVENMMYTCTRARESKHSPSQTSNRLVWFHGSRMGHSNTVTYCATRSRYVRYGPLQHNSWPPISSVRCNRCILRYPVPTRLEPFELAEGEREEGDS